MSLSSPDTSLREGFARRRLTPPVLHPNSKSTFAPQVEVFGGNFTRIRNMLMPGFETQPAHFQYHADCPCAHPGRL